MDALVVDDSRVMRLIVRRVLVDLGFEVTEAGDGVEALERLQADGMPDVVLIDWNMPRMNGLELVQAIRSDRCYDEVRLVMVTTEGEASQMGLALSEGADEYVMKPFTPEVLIDKLALIGLIDAAADETPAGDGW
jgi:two-component system chemotaxis response regulator CheY